MPLLKVMDDNDFFRWMRGRFITQWMLRIFEYVSTIIKAMCIAGDRPIYLRDAEPFPHVVHILNLVWNRKWVISTTGGLFTTGEGISPVYRAILKLTTVGWPVWYKLGRGHIRYSAQDQQTLELMRPLLGDNITVVPLGRRAESKMDRVQARESLNIPLDDMVVMVLGANHSGKDSRVVFAALQGMKHVTLIHAGPTRHSAGDKPLELEARYRIGAHIIDRQIGDGEKRELFGASDWLILSYNRSFLSTTSMLWEACAYGTPVIASSGNRLAHMVKEWGLGLVFEAGNADDLRMHIEFARSEGLRRSCEDNCRDFIKFYSEERWLRLTADLLGLPSAEDSIRSPTRDTSPISGWPSL